jgi:hypothetical protein
MFLPRRPDIQKEAILRTEKLAYGLGRGAAQPGASLEARASWANSLKNS